MSSDVGPKHLKLVPTEMEHLHIHCMVNDVLKVNPTYVVTNSHA